MTRSVDARNRRAALLLLAVLAAVPAAARGDASDHLRRGRRDLEAGRYADAESSFAMAARTGHGDERVAALMLRASIVRDASLAARLYEEVIALDVDGESAREAALELAKIHFSSGRYEGAYGVLTQTRIAESSDEAALFEGMTCVMLRRFEDALPALEQVGRGRFAAWAEVSLAEAEDGLGRGEAACERYADLARERENPTAWYRHAECLARQGDDESTRRELAALAERFPQSPEAIRATARLAPSAPPPAESAPGVTAGEESVPAGRGYTLQFGSFSDRANAIKLAARIKERYPAVRIDSELVNYREVFRVRFGHFGSREEAESVGREMAGALEQSFTVMPMGRGQP